MLQKPTRTWLLCMMLITGSHSAIAQIKPISKTPVIATKPVANVGKITPVNKLDLKVARDKIDNPQWSYTLSAVQTSAAPATMAFAKNRPTVTVFIHGVTGYPTSDERIGTLKGARNYWGFDFVDKFLGAQQDYPTTFRVLPKNTVETIDKNTFETRFIESENAANHFLTIYGKPDLKASTPFYTPFSIMMTYRDGSLSFKKQVAAAAAQIVYLYNSQFGEWPEDKKPQLILLCHSFGGVVARTICSKPSQIPSNDQNVATERFSASERANMEFIRDKTLHITTLSTPHEGSPITKNADVGAFLQQIKLGWFAPFDAIDKTDPDTDILKQLNTSFMENINETILKPELCKRSDGTLIPIHALGGRVPSGPNFFDDPNENDGDLGTIDGGIGRTKIDELNSGETNREKYEAYNLLRVDYIMHLMVMPIIGDKPWGATPRDNQDLDIIKVTDVDAVSGCLKYPLDYNWVNFGLSPRVYYLRTVWKDIDLYAFGVKVPFRGTYKFTKSTGTVRDGEIDNDGFVPINSSLGVKLGTNTKNYFDHKQSWPAANAGTGSWYRFYRSGADFHNHGSIKFSGDVAKWLRENIIGNTPTALLFGTLDRFKAAGPKVSTAGTVSIW